MWPAVDIPGQWAYVLGACVLLAFALAALVRGWRYDRAKGCPRCHKCAYPVAPGNARDVTEAVERAAQQRKQKQPPRSKEVLVVSPTPASRAGCLSNQPKPEPVATTSGAWSCPECGWSPKRVKDLTRTRRSRKWLTASTLLLLFACSTWYTIHVQYRRLTLQEPLPTAMTPTTWWVAMLPHRTGNEDLIVYYRAYPQAKISGTGIHVRPLKGSGRMLSLAPHQYRSRQAGWIALPQWQANFGASRCYAIMNDASRSEADRADAAWLYAELSQLDERDEVAAIAGLVDPASNKSKLTAVVLQELFACEAAPEVYAAMAAGIIEDDRYTSHFRDRACELLAQAGPEAEPYLMAWIAGSNPDMQVYIVQTCYYMLWASRASGSTDYASITRIIASLLTSPYLWNISAGLTLHDHLSFGYFFTASAEYELHLLFRSAFEKLFLHGSLFVVDDALDHAIARIEKMETLVGELDSRVIEMWAWLLSQSVVEAKYVASESLREIAQKVTGVIVEDRRSREALRPIVEEGLRVNLDPVVRDRLEAAIEWLDIGDARTAEWMAERDAAQALPSE